MDLDKAIVNQLANIEKRTGKTIADLSAQISASGLQKHGERVSWAKEHLGLGHGDANAVVKSMSAEVAADPVSEMYSGPKASLRPIHEAVMKELSGWGDFEVHPKKGYVALRRKKQFAMLGPATNTRVELGLNSKELEGGGRLEPQPAGGMCQFKVKLTDESQVDAELFKWLRSCYDSSQ